MMMTMMTTIIVNEIFKFFQSFVRQGGGGLLILKGWGGYQALYHW